MTRRDRCANCRTRALVRPARRRAPGTLRWQTAPVCAPCAAALVALAPRLGLTTSGWSTRSLRTAWPTTTAA